MGTRSLTVFQEEDGSEIAVLYRQFDGYPSGHGMQLKDFLEDFTVVNGLGSDKKAATANGASCLAAQVVAHFKTEPGEFYLHAAGTRDCGEEFIYTVYVKEKQVWLRVQAGAVTYFGLPGTKEQNMPTLYDGPVNEFSAEKADHEHARVAAAIPNDYLQKQKQETT